MAIRNVIKIGDPLLREVSSPITSFDKSLARLIDDMLETTAYECGVGLAAVQVGVLRRVCVICTEEATFELVNPTIVSQKGRQESIEGCLSIPNRHGLVIRPKSVVVNAFDRNGNPFSVEAKDFLATVFCHELDHLDGKVFIDNVIEEVD